MKHHHKTKRHHHHCGHHQYHHYVPCRLCKQPRQSSPENLGISCPTCETFPMQRTAYDIMMIKKFG